MSYRCEHGKDSDICVQCWEEKNLELKPMNELIPLQKAVKRVTNELNINSPDSGEDPSFANDVKELLTAAKQLDGLQDAFIKQHEQLKALQTENEKFRAQHKATEEFLFDSICINKVKHDTSEEGCVYCKCDSLKSALKVTLKTFDERGAALVMLQGMLEAMTKERDFEAWHHNLEQTGLKTQLEIVTHNCTILKSDLKSTRAENVKMREASNNIEMLISELEGIYIGLMMHPSDYHLNGCLISQESKEKMRSITDIINRYKALSTTPPTTTDTKEDVK